MQSFHGNLIKLATWPTVLGFCLLGIVSEARGAVPPCAPDDAECLLRLSLQQTYDLEAERQKNTRLRIANEALNKALDEEQARTDNGGRVFAMGMVVGVVFVGLLTTIALKVIPR
jgi:hypothetical protein